MVRDQFGNILATGLGTVGALKQVRRRKLADSQFKHAEQGSKIKVILQLSASEEDILLFKSFPTPLAPPG